MDTVTRRLVIAATVLLFSVAARAGAQAPEIGPAGAAVTIVEFADFTSEPSARMAAMIKVLVDTYPKDVRVIFKHAPSANVNAVLAHDAALAADAQGKFWEMSDLMFSNQARLGHDDIVGMARQLRLDIQQFSTDLDAGSDRFHTTVDSDRREAAALGIKAPACFLNGEKYTWPMTLEQLKAAVDKRLSTRP